MGSNGLDAFHRPDGQILVLHVGVSDLPGDHGNRFAVRQAHPSSDAAIIHGVEIPGTLNTDQCSNFIHCHRRIHVPTMAR